MPASVLTPPRIPPQHDALVQALHQRRLVVVVGSLIREAAGLVGARGLVEHGLKLVTGGTVQTDIRELTARGQFAAALERIAGEVGPGFCQAFEPLLAGDRPTPPESLRALARLASSLPQILTTNLDNLVETALPGRWMPYSDAPADLAARTEVVFKMLGDARRHTTWRFTRDGLDNATYLAPHFRDQLRALLLGHAFLFIGYRGDDELLAELLRLRAHAPKDANVPLWVALVPPGGLQQRAAFGNRGLQLAVLDVAEDDPIAYDRVVAAYLQDLAGSLPSGPDEAPPAVTLTGNPYPGLAPFEESQADCFFGRLDDVPALVTKLGTGPSGHVRWLMLGGPSGVGKSSLLAAGLVPAIRQGAPPVAGAPRRWVVALMRPGRELLRNLAAAVRDALMRDMGVTLAPEILTRDHLSRDRGLAEFLAPRLQGRGFLLVIDQFEEALTIGLADERPHLDAVLVRSLQDLELPFFLVSAMRSDCMGDLGRGFPRLAEQLNRGGKSVRHDLQPLTASGLREAIVLPAELAGMRFEAGLVERILRDTGDFGRRGGGQPGDAATAPDATLPLVAHILRLLVDRSPDYVLSLRTYEALGGVAEALTRNADTLLAGLRHDFDERTIRDLLVALVDLRPHGRDMRRPLSRTAALQAAGGDASSEARAKAELLLLRLSGSMPVSDHAALPVRLLTVRGEGRQAIVDLVHEALLSEWATLRGWLGENREARLLHRELTRATEAWLAGKRSPDELWRGGRLVRASESLTDVAALAVVEREFLAASNDHEQAEAIAKESERAEKLRMANELASSESSRADEALRRATEARRNNRWLLAFGAIALTVAVIAVLQYRRVVMTSFAETDAAALAEERLNTVSVVVAQILNDTLPKLEKIPSAPPLKEELYQRLTALLSTLLPGSAASGWSQRERLAQHHNLADVEIAQYRFLFARQELTAGLHIAERLVAASREWSVASRIEARQDLLRILIKLGEVELKAHRFSAARAYFERSVMVGEDVLQLIPDSAWDKFKLDQARFSLSQVSWHETEWKRMCVEPQTYEKALESMEDLGFPNSMAQAQRRKLDACFPKFPY